MNRKTGLVLAAAALLTALGAALASVPGRVAKGERVPNPITGEGEGKGLVFRLSEGSPEGAAPPPLKRATAVPIGEAEAAKILARLAPLVTSPEDESEFALREKSLPPPRTGQTVQAAFPPPPGPEAPDREAAGPLAVLRYAPEGDLGLAPNLSVTFSQPMVAVTSHEELAREALPVRLVPEPPGKWRWVGTKTLLFEPTVRFPMATDYAVEVPAGTRSATGGSLGAAKAWRFSTPPPRLVTSYPVNQPARPDTLLFAAFDQRVDAQAVAATIRVKTGAAGATRVRLATAEEVKADEAVSRLAKDAGEGRWVALKTEARLPSDSPVTVSVAVGTPSAEGPKKTTKAQEWSFRTYGPLRVTAHRCGWRGDCPPFTPWQIEFSNPIDAKAFRKEMLSVQPDLPALAVDVHGNGLSIRGRTKGRTLYRVGLSASVPDVFGQTLEKEAAVTFQVTAAHESLSAQGGNFVVLDPAAGKRFSVYTVNHETLKVRAHVVTPEDWPAFHKYMEAAARREDDLAKLPGRPAIDTVVRVQGAPDELVETRIDLTPALQGASGQLVLLVQSTRVPKEAWRRQQVVAWVQSTQIGLAAFVDRQEMEMTAWATSLGDGAPLAGVELSLLGTNTGATTDAGGLARLGVTSTAGTPLVARLGKDVALLPENLYWWSQTPWAMKAADADLRWFVFDDRKMYRPGEEVRLKGWLRLVLAGRAGDVRPLDGSVREVKYALRDSQGNEVTKGTLALTTFGAFDLTLKLPPTMNLGAASVTFEAGTAAGTDSHYHGFEVQEFRRPEFEVTATPSEGPYFVGGKADVAVTAGYYAGGGLAGADVTWRVSSSPGSFTPPNRDDFTFGTWTPWWESFAPRGETPRVETYASRTDAQGRHHVRIDFDSVDPPQPTNVVAEATVMDVNRQAWTARANLLVHPGSAYVGLRSERLFVQRGEEIKVEAIVTDLDGRAVPGRSTRVRAERLEWERGDTEWKERPAAREDCAVTSKEDPVRCAFHAGEGGTYRITASVRDEQGRENQSQIRVWVAGGQMPPRRQVEQEKVTLVPGKKEYRAGETAQILVLAPFPAAEGLLTLRRSGLVKTERFAMTGSSHTLQVRLDPAWTPNVHLQVDLVGAAPRTTSAGEIDPKLPKRPAFAAGSLAIPIPPHERTLALKVAPHDKALEPGGQTVVDVELRDAAGRPVSGAEVAAVVVDEAVLSLTGYRLPDPVKVFYAPRESGVSDHHLRASVVLGRPEEMVPDESVDQLQAAGGALEEGRVATMAPPPQPASKPVPEAKMRMARGKEEAAAEPIRVRADFAALALFAASLPTDSEGKAHVSVKLPDSLTRYRIMAVAAEGNRFGSAESTLTARLPLMVRPSPPRFLNFGDRFELPVVLQNQTDSALTVDVAVRAANAQVVSGSGRRVTVDGNDRVEVRFPMAAEKAGTARFQVAAVSGRWADAGEFQLPVWTPATTEAFAVYGTIDKGSVLQPVKAPEGVVRQFGGLEVTTSSTALQALTDAVLYLVAYPFECAEQISSRVMAVAALKDVLTAFEAKGLPKPDEMIAAVKRDVDRLRLLQNEDGGFAFWRRGDESWAYISIHVAHALLRAREKGFDVPAPMLDRSRSYLKDIERHIPPECPDDVRRTLVAYALYVRQRMGDADPGRARGLIKEAGLEKLSFEAVGWILPVLSKDAASRVEVESIRRHLANKVSEEAGTAHFVVSYGDGAHLILHSNRRADAVLLEALIADEPGSDLIPKLVEGLLGHRQAGRWSNTQENAFVLLALDRYFNTYEKVTPDFVARAWLGEAFAGEHAFRGRSTERQHLIVPMRLLDEGKATKDLILAKDGAGRLYYRIGLQYAPSSLRLEPSDHGFTVERAYEAVDDKGDVMRDAQGVWHIRSGSRVRVRVSMVAPGRRYHVALVDPVPAGLEPMNPALAVTGTIPAGPPASVDVVSAPGLGGPSQPGWWWWWRRTWFDHQNMRDERVEAFAALLWEGVYTYGYVARATTPGEFVVPPPKAEEMYHPETFGRGATDRVVVE